MPPAVSESEHSLSEDEIPARKELNDDDEGDEDEDGDEYVVEKILGHEFRDDGECLYLVKWLGYNKKSDRTLEPEDNLANAVDVLKEYHDSIGGRPEAPVKSGRKRRGRKSNVSESNATPVPVKRIKWEKPWEPPAGSWENDIKEIDTISEETDPKTGDKKRNAMVVWKDGQKRMHPLLTLNRKAPQQMLRYYEGHLVFTFHEKPEDVVGNDDDDDDDDEDDEVLAQATNGASPPPAKGEVKSS